MLSVRTNIEAPASSHFRQPRIAVADRSRLRGLTLAFGVQSRRNGLEVGRPIQQIRSRIAPEGCSGRRLECKPHPYPRRERHAIAFLELEPFTQPCGKPNPE